MQSDLSRAIEACSEHNFQFSRSTLITQIYARTSPFSLEEVNQAIDLSEQCIQLENNQFTTELLLWEQAKLLKSVEASRGTRRPIANLKTISIWLNPLELSAYERNTLSKTLQSQDYFVCWRVGRGQQNQQRALELAEAVKIFAQSCGIQVELVASVTKNEILKICERQVNGTNLQILMNLECKSIGLGELSPISFLQANGLRTLYLSEVEEQKDKAKLDFRALKYFQSGQVEAGFICLAQGDRLIETGDNLYEQAAIAYVQLPIEKQVETLVLVENSMARQLFKDAVVQCRKSQASARLKQLMPKEMEESKSKISQCYDVGDYLQPQRTYSKRDLIAQAFYQIESIQEDELVLSDAANTNSLRSVKFAEIKKKIYQSELVDVRVGDRLEIPWGRHSKLFEGIVVSLQSGRAKIQLKNGAVQELDLSQPHIAQPTKWIQTWNEQSANANRYRVVFVVGYEGQGELKQICQQNPLF